MLALAAAGTWRSSIAAWASWPRSRRTQTTPTPAACPGLAGQPQWRSRLAAAALRAPQRRVLQRRALPAPRAPLPTSAPSRRAAPEAEGHLEGCQQQHPSALSRWKPTGHPRLPQLAPAWAAMSSAAFLAPSTSPNPFAMTHPAPARRSPRGAPEQLLHAPPAAPGARHRGLPSHPITQFTSQLDSALPCTVSLHDIASHPGNGLH